MTTSSDEVTDDDLLEFLYCPQGYYLTYLIESGLQPSNGLSPELLGTLGLFYREYVKVVGKRPDGAFVSEDDLRKADLATFPFNRPVEEQKPKTLRLSMWDRAKLQTTDDFQNLADRIRRVRRQGLPARLCGKKKCICGCLAGELHRVALENRHISVVHGINDKIMAALEDMGIFSWEQLLQTSTSKIVAKLTERTLPATNIEKVKHSAKSYVEGRAVVFGTIPPIGSSYVVLDIEYLQDDPSCPLFLIGVCVVTDDKPPEYHNLWAESGEEEKTIVKGLATLLDAHHELPIITWGWDDIRRLAKAAWRLRVDLPNAVFGRYRDLYKEFDDAVRIPSKKMSLEAVATWLGFKRRSTLPKGDIWRVLDRDYCNRNKKQMIEYNRDDLDMLICVCEEIAGPKAE